MEIISMALPASHSYSDDQEFEKLFKANFNALHAYAFSILKDEDLAEEIVQGMFLKFWERRHHLNIQSIKAYLYKSVYNDSLNHLKHEKTKHKYHVFTKNSMNSENEDASSRMQLSELQHQIGKAMAQLPQQCRTIFQLSRFEELKYREIADQLGISVKTVENQMGKALKILRYQLADFLILLALNIISLNDFFK